MKINVSRTNLIAYGLFVASLLILGTSAYFVMNIKVIENWKLTIDESVALDDIHVGDTITLKSTYTKLRGSSGESIRYIECQNKSGVWIRYELNRATPNRAIGTGGTGIPLTIRRDIADVPTTCKFTVAIRYDVLPFKSVNVSNSSKNFHLLSERTVLTSSEGSSVLTSGQTAASPSPVSSSSLPASSSSNTTVTNTVAQPEIPQPAETASPATSNAGIPVVTPILNVIRGLL